MVSISGLALISLLFLSPPVTPSSSNDKAVVAVADAYSAAMLKGDVAAVMAVYTDDALEMPPNAAPVQGRADLEAYYKKQL